MPGDVVGSRLGRYEVVSRIGSGGMGAVFRGHDPTLDRDVAIKLVLGGRGDADEARLLREGQALARLVHPNVAAVYDVGRSSHGPFVAMELIDGLGLHDWQVEARPSWREIVAVFEQAGRGLAAGHAIGIVHRDFKPSNAMVDRTGRARVLDFGLARQWSDPQERTARGPGDDHGASSLLRTQLTADGAIVGTPLYMAPEQHRGEPATAAADQYSFCLALWEALAGAFPYTRGTIEAVSAAKSRPPDPPPVGDVPRVLWTILRRGLCAAPDDRWPSMPALLTRLHRVARPSARAWPLVALASGVLFSAALTTQLLEGGPRCTGGEELEPIWNEQRDRELEAEFRRVAPDIGADAWATASERIEAWSGRWSATHQRACEVARDEEQDEAALDARMSCLRDRVDALAAVLEGLEAPEPEIVARASGAVDALPDPSGCLAAQGAEAEIADPERNAQIADVRARLRRARASYDLGRIERGLALAEEAVEPARTLGDRALLGDALLQRASLRRVSAHVDEAITDDTEAYFLALEGGDTERTAQAAVRLVFAFAMRADHEDATIWAGHARAAIDRNPSLSWMGAGVENALGDLERRGGRPEAARASFARALSTLREDPGGADPMDEPRILANLGNVLAELGRYDEAVTTLREGLEAAQRRGGAHHPSVATVLSALGIALWYRGDAREAVEVLTRAESLTAAIHGAAHPRRIDVLGNLAGAMVDEGRAEAALPVYTEAIALATDRTPVDDAVLARLLGGKGVALERLGRPREAVAVHRDALRHRSAARPDGHPEVGISRANLGAALRGTGELEESERHLRDALAIFVEALGAEHPRTTLARASLSRTLSARGLGDQALELARAAEAVAERIELDPRERAEVDLAVAEALRAAAR